MGARCRKALPHQPGAEEVGDEEAVVKKKVVAVVGGGAGGLICCKRFLEEGLEVVAFERADQLGGLWVFRDGPEGKTYASLRANVHKSGLQMEDFPMPESWAGYPSHWQLAEYLQAFARYFNLEKLYKMETEVVSCKRDDRFTERWVIRYRPVGGSEQEEETLCVDAICMCVGQTCSPFIPEYPGQSTFQGLMLHSSMYRKQTDFVGKKVLVIGAGAASGTDVAQDLSFGARQVFLSMRRGVLLLPRFVGGRPNAKWLDRHVWSYVPLAWLLRVTVLFIHMITYECTGTGSQDWNGIVEVSLLDIIRTHLDELRLADWTATDSCNLTQRVAIGAIRARGCIESFTERGVKFSDGAYEEVDAVIWATGFRRDSTNFGCDVGDCGKDGKERLKFWRQVFHPSVPNFACCLQTHPYGSHWAVADIEARWIAAVFSGKLELPPQHEMEKEAAELGDHQASDTCLDWRRVSETAEQMGCGEPRFLKLLWYLLLKPTPTVRWLLQSRSSRRIAVEECEQPLETECKYQTSL